MSSGHILSGRYRLEDLIHEWSGSSSWLAKDTTLTRSVGIQALPHDDRRAKAFLAAARASTTVTDPRFLRVLDIVESEDGVTYLVREWARAFPLHVVLNDSSMPNRRAATVMAEVAEAIGNAHEVGVYHQHLTPQNILLKQSGAVRITGLAIDHALLTAMPDEIENARLDVQYAEQLDVQGIGKLLYACLAGRWPGARINDLRKAPTEHGRLMRPRQVRAGVSRDVDTVCDRILGTPPRHHEPPLRSARDIAHRLHLAGVDDTFSIDDQPSLIWTSSYDLFRNDPVVAPLGPPPAINPPKPKPAALAPPPPTTYERSMAKARRATEGDRALILSGVAVALALVTVLAFIVGRASNEPAQRVAPDEPLATTNEQSVGPLKPVRIDDFDPQGGDREENPRGARLAIDGDRATGWRTSEYYGRADLAGLKSGVGLVLDLGRVRAVDSVQVVFGNAPTSIDIRVADPGTERTPRTLGGLRRVGSYQDADDDVSISLRGTTQTRYVVVWLTSLPEQSAGVFRGDVREIMVRGPR